jgi:putative phosphoesterase
MKVGVISDTHNFFDPKIPSLFAGVEHILHAGDIGNPTIIAQLEEIAPVTAVNGNTDDPAFRYPQTRIIEIEKTRFLIHHIVSPHVLEASLAARIKTEQAGWVLFGHTHKPFWDIVNGITFFNPGYAGKSRFGMERTLAILECDAGGIKHRYVPL